jgi:indole-3-glycerol phosphate synthase
MNGFLARVIKEKEEEVIRLKELQRDRSAGKAPYPLRDFAVAVSRNSGIDLIAEIKPRSPSSGTLRKEIDVTEIALIYERQGASAISLITDRIHFGGDIGHLSELKARIGLPLLRKDFIIDESQVLESFSWGADAVLFIARILPEKGLQDLISLTTDLGMTPLVEIHDEEDLHKALCCGATVIGINNRNLDTFQIDLDTTRRLAPKVSQHCVTIAESGIGDGEDIRSLLTSGVHGVLVGTALMKSEDISKKVTELVEAGRI